MGTFLPLEDSRLSGVHDLDCAKFNFMPNQVEFVEGRPASQRPGVQAKRSWADFVSVSPTPFPHVSRRAQIGPVLKNVPFGLLIF